MSKIQAVVGDADAVFILTFLKKQLVTCFEVEVTLGAATVSISLKIHASSFSAFCLHTFQITAQL